MKTLVEHITSMGFAAVRNRIRFVLMVEGRVDDVRAKFPDMDLNVFQDVVQSQPPGSNNKYLDWSVRQVNDGFAVEVVAQAVRGFNSVQNKLEKRDLNSYKDVGELETAVQAVGVSKRSQEKAIGQESDLVYKDERFVVIRPNTKAASCKYGAGTKWCISASQSHNYFESYSSGNNKFYFVIDRNNENSKDPNSKFAIVFLPLGRTTQIQIFDSSDKIVPESVVKSVTKDSWEPMMEAIKRHVEANPDSWEIKREREEMANILPMIRAGQEVKPETISKWYRSAENVPEDIQLKLAKHPSPNVRYTVALDPNTSQSVLKLLLNDSVDYIRSTAASKIKLEPGELKNALLTFPVDQIHGIISKHELSPELVNLVVDRVATLDSYQLRYIFDILLKNYPLTVEQVIKMQGGGLGRENESTPKLFNEMIVTAYAKQQSKVPIDDLFKFAISNIEKKKYLWKVILKDDDLLPQELVQRVVMLSMDKAVPYDRFDVLRSTQLDSEFLSKAWEKGTQADRMAILQNPATPVEVLTKFAGSGNSAYRFAVAHNTKTPLETLIALSDDESASTRAAVAANPSSSSPLVDSLSGDQAQIVRLNVASNSRASTTVLRTLIGDRDRYIARTAGTTLKNKRRTESIIERSFARLLVEAWDGEDEEMEEMTPAWDQLPKASVTNPEFVAIYLLQNGGSGSIEQISAAMRRWSGSPVSDGLFAPSGGDKILRGNDTQSRGWWWAEAGTRGEAIYRLSAQGAAAAIQVLKQLREDPEEDKVFVPMSKLHVNKVYGLGRTEIAYVMPELGGRRPGYIRPAVNSTAARWENGAAIPATSTPVAGFDVSDSKHAHAKHHVSDLQRIKVTRNVSVTYLGSMLMGEVKPKGNLSKVIDRNMAIVKTKEGKVLIVSFPLKNV